MDLEVRLDAVQIVNSIAKGTDDHITSLINYGLVDVLLAMTLARCHQIDLRILESCLCTLKTIMTHRFAPFELIYSNPDNISRLIGEFDGFNILKGSVPNNNCFLFCFAEIAQDTDMGSWKIQSYITYILVVPTYQTAQEQLILYNSGILILLAKEIISGNCQLQLPALKCLASICFMNKHISFAICNTQYNGVSLPEVLNELVSRTQPISIQLGASRCLTYLYRTDALSAKNSKIVYKAMPCLVRLCSPEFDEPVRSAAANYLAYLTEVETELQRMASICYHLIDSLINLLRSPSQEAKHSAFRCIASICANDEEIRKKVVEKENLMDEIMTGMKSSSPEVRLSAVRCLHSLSRSVQLLRTTFQDHFVWRPLLDLINMEPTSLDMLKVLSSTICNLLLEFSPAKEHLLENGALELLCRLTFNSDATLRLNGIWGLMNLSFGAEENVKTKIIDCLGTDSLFRLLNDEDVKIVIKTLGLLRNILSSTKHIKVIMEQHSVQLLKAVSVC